MQTCIAGQWILEQADGNTGKIIKQLTALECVIIPSRDIAVQCPVPLPAGD